VLAQDTGFGPFLAAGDGLLPFRTIDDVLEGIGRINADYCRHAKAARALAEEHFDSDRVLTSLLDRVGTSAGAHAVPAAVGP
jgi:hypothetical protein